jgi:hypothetical protein
MKLLNRILLLIILLAPALANAQQVEEKLIVKDAGDSLLLKAFRTAFDTDGNYYFETLQPGKGERFAMITNKEKHSPVFWSRNIGLAPYKSVLADAFFADSLGRRMYYKNKSGTRIYGPRPGRVRNVLEYGKDNVAMELCIGSKSFLYINDSMVNEADSLHQLWLCSFSDIGHVLYTVYKRGMFRLYLDHKEIDSAEEIFSEIAVNNSGFYGYVKPLGGKFYVHTSAGRFGPFGSVDYSDLWNNGAYFYRGCADSQCFVLVNGKQYERIPEAHSIEDGVYRSEEQVSVQPYAPDGYVFTYNRQDEEGIFTNVNGKITKHNYSSTGFLFTDKQGNYAFYGYRRDTMGVERVYRNINGKETKLPSFRRARYRPYALQVSPDGSSTFYYATADSIYLFRNDTFLCPPAHKSKFGGWDASILPQAHPEGLEYFQGISINGVSYIIYNNTISKPLPLINPKYDIYEEPQPGSIVAGDMNKNGFYIIEQTGKGKYQLVINNTVYKELTGIDHIAGTQGYFDAHKLIFYGTKVNSYYQFTVRY